jgi:hypothetical protein
VEKRARLLAERRALRDRLAMGRSKGDSSARDGRGPVESVVGVELRGAVRWSRDHPARSRLNGSRPQYGDKATTQRADSLVCRAPKSC